MRTAFFKTLLAAAKNDPSIHLVTGDLGFGVIEEFADSCPSQLINAGVAEQSMTGIAVGLALSGAKTFTYSIANFPTLRCLEQVRNDIGYHQADVTVVAVGGGLAYGALGMSHHATEDLAVMRALPEFAVAAPGDPVETEAVVENLIAEGGPAYLRLGKSGEPTVHQMARAIPRGGSVVLREGTDVALLSTGAILPVVAEAADRLVEEGLSVRLVSLPWLYPIDESEIRRAADECSLLVTVEEHSVVGGLGGAVAEIVAGMASHAPLVRIGLPRRFTSVVGSQQYLRQLHGLDPARIVERITEAWGTG